MGAIVKARLPYELIELGTGYIAEPLGKSKSFATLHALLRSHMTRLLLDSYLYCKIQASFGYYLHCSSN